MRESLPIALPKVKNRYIQTTLLECYFSKLKKFSLTSLVQI